MQTTDLATWDDARWEAEYNALMTEARLHLQQKWQHGEVVVLKTASDAVRVLEIPDFMDATVREPLENAFLHTLLQDGQTQFLLCLATFHGQHPEIISRNLMDGLIKLDEGNLETVIFLRGEGVILAKTLRRLLPPKK